MNPDDLRVYEEYARIQNEAIERATQSASLGTTHSTYSSGGMTWNISDLETMVQPRRTTKKQQEQQLKDAIKAEKDLEVEKLSQFLKTGKAWRMWGDDNVLGMRGYTGDTLFLKDKKKLLARGGQVEHLKPQLLELAKREGVSFEMTDENIKVPKGANVNGITYYALKGLKVDDTDIVSMAKPRSITSIGAFDPCSYCGFCGNPECGDCTRCESCEEEHDSDYCECCDHDDYDEDF